MFNFSSVKKILIIRFSSIGDIVLTTPVMRCIKAQHPNIKIHYATKSSFKCLLEHNPYIDHIHVLDRNLHHLIQELWAENFDYIIDLHNNIRSHRIALALLKRVGRVHKLNLGKWLLVNTKSNLIPTSHIVERYLDAASALQITNDQQGLDFFLPPELNMYGLPLPASHRHNYIAWVIGGKHKTKVFPANKIINICRMIDLPVVLLGDGGDKLMGDTIASEVPSVFNAAGLLSIHASALVVQEASVVVTNDTGLMHVAAAFGKKIVSLWGSTVKEFGMYPYMPQAKFNYRTIEEQNLPCRPCSKIGFSECPKTHFKCMNDINDTDVAEAVKGFL